MKIRMARIFNETIQTSLLIRNTNRNTNTVDYDRKERKSHANKFSQNQILEEGWECLIIPPSLNLTLSSTKYRIVSSFTFSPDESVPIIRMTVKRDSLQNMIIKRRMAIIFRLLLSASFKYQSSFSSTTLSCFLVPISSFQRLITHPGNPIWWNFHSFRNHFCLARF